ncbi:MAG TPA: hypothetical protein VLW45_08725, partial [Pelomicrobium sp.]|nr:hypothetical protein [Pelomicrobium sp.]
MLAATAVAIAAAPPRAEISLGRVVGPDFSLAGVHVSIDLAAPSRGEAVFRDVRVAGRALGDIRLTCADLDLY